MTAPELTWPDNAWLTYAEATRRWGRQTSPKQAEYVRRDPAVIAALPEVQALVAGAYEAAAQRLESLWRENSGYKIAQVRALTPAEALAAQAARDKRMIAEGMRRAIGIYVNGPWDVFGDAVAAILAAADQVEAQQAGGRVMRDMDLSDDDVNEIVRETAQMIILRSGGDRAAQLNAGLGTLMWITRNHGMRDADIVDLLGEMYAANPRGLDA